MLSTCSLCIFVMPPNSVVWGDPRPGSLLRARMPLLRGVCKITVNTWGVSCAYIGGWQAGAASLHG